MSNEKNGFVRSLLGLGDKTEGQPSTLKDDTHEVVTDPVTAELAALEASVEQDKIEASPAELAAIQLAEFELSAGAASLIDRSLDSLSKNTGAGLEDENAKQRARGQAALIRATGNDLSVVIDATIASTPVLEVGGAVYGILYAVLKQCLFFANLDRNQATGMDVYSDEITVEDFFVRYVEDRYVSEALARVVDNGRGSVDLSPDQREQERDAPVGLDTRREAQLEALRAVYGSEEPIEAVLQALRDVRFFFQLTTESLGWDPERPMPFSNVQLPNGLFEPITDAEVALDATEIKRKASQIRRQEKQVAQLGAAQAAAAKILQERLAAKNRHPVR